MPRGNGAKGSGVGSPVGAPKNQARTDSTGSPHTFGALARALFEASYLPVPVVGKKAIVPGWTAPYRFKPGDEKRKDYANCNVGLITGHGVVGLDIDIRNPALAAKIIEAAHKHLGAAPTRTGAAPKALLLYRLAGELRKIQTPGYAFKDDPPEAKAQKIEVLALGQQFVAYGIHPDTNAPYTWSGGEPKTLKAHELPLLDEAKLRSFLGTAQQWIEAHGGRRVGRLRATASDVMGAPAEHREARDPAECREVIAAIPNADEAWDDWVLVGLAIKAALGDDGRDDFIAWSARSKKHNAETTAKQWDSFKPTRVGAGTLYHLARVEGGWKPAIERGDAILIKAGRIALMIDTVDAYLGGQRMVFRRGELLVRLLRWKEAKTSGAHQLKRADDAVVAVVAGPQMVYELMARHLTWCRIEKDGRRKVADPPPKIAELFVHKKQWANVAPLVSITQGPTMLPDGTLIVEPGYHAASGLFYAGVGGLDVPDRPSEPQARAALSTLLDPFCDFVFATEADRAAYVAAILTAVVRPTITYAPAFLVTAPTYGSGKTLLADCLGLVALGTVPGHASFTPNNEEEARKLITATVLAGDPIMVLDNVSGVFRSEKFAKLLTDDVWMDRVLGGNTMMRAAVRVLVVLTGNNVQLSRDNVRRFMRVRIDPGVEHPETRTGFRYPDLPAHVRSVRVPMLRAALTILRWNAVAKFPKPSGALTLGTYEDWSRIVAWPLMRLGLPNIVRVEEAGADDPEKEALGLVFRFALAESERLRAAAAERQRGLIYTDELGAALNNFNNPTPDAIAVRGIVDTRRGSLAQGVGYYFRNNEGRFADGLRLRKLDHLEKRTGTSRARSTAWCVEEGSPLD